MFRFAKSLLFLILLGAIFVARGQAQTINAASCNSIDVQSALKSVSTDGTTVNIPAGTCIWATTITYNQKYSTTIQGQTTVTGTCAPGGSCSAADTTVIQTTTANSALAITAAANKSIRVTGITFLYSSGGTQDSGVVAISGATQSMRVDHSHFIHSNQVDVFVNGSTGPILGVVDHNLFNENVLGFGIHAAEGNWSGTEQTGDYPSGLGNSSWADASYWGSNKFVFFENNTFVWDPGGNGSSFVFDCNPGGRLVARFNQANNFAFQTHGTGSGDANYRGCREIEAYGNSLVHNGTYFAVIQEEGGGYMFWGNTVGNFGYVIEEDTIRTNSTTYGQTTPPNGWGYCGNQVSGADSAWDGNASASTGYPCLDQVGRGGGDLIVGEFPSKKDNVSGKVSWPNQVIDPVYAFANTVSGATNYWYSFCQCGIVAENRDYYLQLPNVNEPQSFDGSAGIGQGPLASKPSTCTTNGTTGAAWWGTDQGSWNTSGNGFGNGVLYTCSATNTWTAYYTPYTYPHPLVTGSQSSGVPNAPTNLSATVN
jgi:hypothetical protein